MAFSHALIVSVDMNTFLLEQKFEKSFLIVKRALYKHAVRNDIAALESHLELLKFSGFENKLKQKKH